MTGSQHLYGPETAALVRAVKVMSSGLTEAEINGNCEANTGVVIVERFHNLEPIHCPAVLVASHGPFTWGKDAADALHNGAILEYVAPLASESMRSNPQLEPMQPVLLDKHYLSKQRPKAYYGQS